MWKKSKIEITFDNRYGVCTSHLNNTTIYFYTIIYIILIFKMAVSHIPSLFPHSYNSKYVQIVCRYYAYIIIISNNDVNDNDENNNTWEATFLPIELRIENCTQQIASGEKLFRFCRCDGQKIIIGYREMWNNIQDSISFTVRICFFFHLVKRSWRKQLEIKNGFYFLLLVVCFCLSVEFAAMICGVCSKKGIHQDFW